MPSFQQRKRLRIPDYDYSQANFYFITICAKDRAEIFSRILSSDTFNTAQVSLTTIGKYIEQDLEKIPQAYQGITIDSYIIMPNHLHLMLAVEGGSSSISQVINAFKGGISRKAGRSIWQRSFHDHVVRNQQDYERLVQYIDNNPAQWELDSLNPKNA